MAGTMLEERTERQTGKMFSIIYIAHNELQIQNGWLSPWQPLYDTWARKNLLRQLYDPIGDSGRERRLEIVAIPFVIH